jgi:serine/threonine-protein kinase
MPPLQAPPQDEDAWLEEPEEPRRGRRWAWVVAALALVLLLAGGAWWLLNTGDRGGGNTASTNPTVTSASSTGVVVDPAAYIGEPADDVEAALTGQGLTALREAASAGQLEGAGMALEAGDVAALQPTGPVPADAEITLYVAEEAYAPEEAEPTDDEEPAETTASTTSSATTTTSSSSSSSSSSSTSTTTATTTTTLPGDPGEDPPACEPPADCDGDGVPDEAADPDAGAADQGGAG